MEAERIAKEEAIRLEQLAKSQASQRKNSARRNSSPPPPKLDALKGFALVLPSGAAAGSAAPSKRSAQPSERPTGRASQRATAAAEEDAERMVAEPDAVGTDAGGESPFHNRAAARQAASSNTPPVRPSPRATALPPAAVEESGSSGGDAAPAMMEAPSAVAPSPPAPSLDSAGDRATGMASASPSPAASPASEADGGDDEFAHAEAEAERQAASEEARKAKDAAADALSLDLRLGRGSVDLTSAKGGGKAASSLAGYDDLGDDFEEGEGAHSAVEAALKAVTGSRPSGGSAPHGDLFAKGSHLSASSGSLSSSFSAIRLSEAMGSMPHDDFLDRLQRAEARPISPGGMKHAGVLPPKPSVLGSGVTMPGSALFNRGVVA